MSSEASTIIPSSEKKVVSRGEQRDLYIERRAKGDSPTLAATIAGYKGPYLAGYRLERRPDIKDAIAKRQGNFTIPSIREPLTKAEALSLLTQLARSSETPSVCRVSAIKLCAELEKWTESGVRVGVQLIFGREEANL